jgi:hypothetical protein
MTLTQVATITRRGILIGSILLFLGTIAFVGYQIWYANYLASLPPVEEKPDVKFGSLPSPEFIKSSVSTSNFSYQIATETGGLPDFGKVIKVYFIPKASATFLAQDKARDLAKKFSIDNPPEASSESQFQFKQDNKRLIIDLNTSNFTYRKDATITAQPASDGQALIRNFRDLLSRLSILHPSLKDSPGKYEGGIIMLWPKDIDGKRIVTGRFRTPLITAVAGDDGDTAEDYTEINFTFWPVDENTFSTYPVKTTATALEDLKTGKGVVVVIPKQTLVSLTSIYLAYYQNESYSPYLQPVFVFEGPNFVAYVPAITDEFIAKRN